MHTKTTPTLPALSTIGDIYIYLGPVGRYISSRWIYIYIYLVGEISTIGDIHTYIHTKTRPTLPATAHQG
jgi:hypothetical protein